MRGLSRSRRHGSSVLRHRKRQFIDLESWNTTAELSFSTLWYGALGEDMEKPPSRRKENGIDHPEVVSAEKWEAAQKGLRAKEKGLTRRSGTSFRAERRRLPRTKVGKALRVRGPAGQGRAPGPIRGPAPADPLPLHVRAEQGRGLRRLLHVHRPGRPSRPPACEGRDLRDHLTDPVREARAVQAAPGLGASVVLLGRR